MTQQKMNLDKRQELTDKQVQVLNYRFYDDREPDTIRFEMSKYGWIQKRLHTGDFSFYSRNFKRIGIERKTVDDLLASIGTRLSRQLEESLEAYDNVILIIEGSWKKATDSQSIVIRDSNSFFTWDMIWNFLARFQDKGVKIQLTTSSKHTVHRIIELYALYQKEYSISSNSKEFGDDRVLAMPSGARGKSGMNVIKTLGSLKTVANASIEELEAVDGIGKKRANTIFNHFNRGE